MRRLLALSAIGLLVVVAGGAAADTFAVTLVSQTTSTVTLGWSPQPGYGYLFSANGVLVSRTNDPNRSTVKFSKANTYDIDVITKGANGHYPAAPPPPPKAQCEDGVDNDGDSKIDYPADPGCTGATDNDETDTSAGQVALTQVDGGTSYYSQFTFPLSNTVFPIGVWFESVITQNDVDLDKDAGLNMYIMLTSTTNMSLVRSNGMRAFIQEGEITTYGSELAGWVLWDEMDMQCGPPNCDGYGRLNTILAGLPNDGRARYNNYGKGVMFWESDQNAQRWVNEFNQLVSNDIYWFTDPGGVCSAGEGGGLLNNGQPLTQSQCRRASNYGETVKRMRFLDGMDGQRKPIWNFVEVGHPFSESDSPTITGPQIRAAVWHSIIAGARGIIYFNHNFGGPCQSQHVLRDSCGAAVRPTVKAVDDQVQSLAGVLNSPTVTTGFTASTSVKAMAKWNGSNFYVFSGSANNASATGTMTIGCVGNATATVLGENRTVNVNGGTITDSFADGNSVHVYRIDGGGRCGL